MIAKGSCTTIFRANLDRRFSYFSFMILFVLKQFYVYFFEILKDPFKKRKKKNNLYHNNNMKNATHTTTFTLKCILFDVGLKKYD